MSELVENKEGLVSCVLAQIAISDTLFSVWPLKSASFRITVSMPICSNYCLQMSLILRQLTALLKMNEKVIYVRTCWQD